MAKMNAKNDKVTYKDPRDAHYATKKDMIIKQLDFPISMFFDIESSSFAVIAEDSAGFYITCKKFISQVMLDPCRMYRRTNTIVKKLQNNENSFEISTPLISNLVI